MDPLRAVLAGYRPRDVEESAHVDRLRAVADTTDAWSRAGALHVTASALVVDPVHRRVLLRWHTRMQQWMQVGGHADPGELDPWLVARREAQEETGLDDLGALTPALEREPVQIVIVPVPAGHDEPAHEHADIRYVFATAHPDRVRAESSDAAVRWMDFADARAEISEPNLLEFLARVEQLVGESTL